MSSHRLLTYLASIGLALTFIPYLAWDRGPIVGVGLLLLGGVITASVAYPQGELRPYKTLIFLLVTCSLTWFLINAYHGEPLSSYDLASRYLLSTLVLLLLIQHLPSFTWFLTCMALGALVAAAIGSWQFYVLDHPRAGGFTGIIQFGDIALMMGVFSLGGVIYQLQNQPRWHWLLCVLGSVAGLYSSLLSGSRGGWIAIPFVVLIILLGLLNRNNAKRLLSIIGVVLIATSIAASKSESFNERIDLLQYDIHHYLQGNPNTSIGKRLALWVETQRLVREQPFTGYPSDNYQAEREKIAEAQPTLRAAMELANTHNSFLEILIFYGTIGLLPFIALLIYSVRKFALCLRSRNTQQQAVAMCGTTLIICYVIFGQSQVMFHRNNTLVFFLISLVYLWVSLNKELQPVRTVAK